MPIYKIENFQTQEAEGQLGYYPASLRHCKSDGWFMEYYFLNPYLEKMERRRVHLNIHRKRFRTVAEFKQFANELVSSTNIKLMTGWSPYGQTENSRYFTPLQDVIMQFISEKERSTTEETMRSYKSLCTRFITWLTVNMPDCKSGQFTQAHAQMFMDFLYFTPIQRANPNSAWQKRLAKAKKKDPVLQPKAPKMMSPNSYNSLLKQIKVLGAWMEKKQFTRDDPFHKIEKMKEVEKIRDVIPTDDRKRILSYFRDNLPQFEIIYHLVLSALLRPIEISRVQVEDIDFEAHCIMMPGSKTKNHKPRTAPLTDEMLVMLAKHTQGASPKDYLFGLDYNTGKVAMDEDRYTYDWQKMRSSLNMPSKYQLYSLRDTGLSYMMSEGGLDPLLVMQAADHSDLSITTKYVKHKNIAMVETVRAAAPKY